MKTCYVFVYWLFYLDQFNGKPWFKQWRLYKLQFIILKSCYGLKWNDYLIENLMCTMHKFFFKVQMLMDVYIPEKNGIKYWYYYIRKDFFFIFIRSYTFEHTSNVPNNLCHWKNMKNKQFLKHLFLYKRKLGGSNKKSVRLGQMVQVAVGRVSLNKQLLFCPSNDLLTLNKYPTHFASLPLYPQTSSSVSQ